MSRYNLGPFFQVAFLAILIRALLLVYSEWQDRNFEVKYTDVDYWVFSDAASAMFRGMSPFTRSTYRYTPLLAALLIPNEYFGTCWGKILFSFCDIVTGYFIYLFLVRVTSARRSARITAFFWLLNPFVFTISTRGNAESIISSLLLPSLYYLTSGKFFLAGLFFGLAVHFKLFPVIYGVAMLSFLVGGKTRRLLESPVLSPKMGLSAPATPVKITPSSANSSPEDGIRRRRRKETRDYPQTPRTPINLSTPQKIHYVPLQTPTNRFLNIFVFGLSSLSIFTLLTFACYHLYGDEYLQEAILYHLSRKDHRHNFSPYFYLFYTEAALALPKNFELLVFIPQILIFLFAGLKFGKKDLAFACFIITFVFVTFNKVITSQYFIWYLSIFPIAYASLHNVSKLRWASIATSWFGAQALWLHFAYKLEFQGHNVFLHLWASSILFMVVNVWIIGQFIRHRFVREILHAGPGIITLNTISP